eukprot:g2516.t1
MPLCFNRYDDKGDVNAAPARPSLDKFHCSRPGFKSVASALCFFPAAASNTTFGQRWLDSSSCSKEEPRKTRPKLLLTDSILDEDHQRLQEGHPGPHHRAHQVDKKTCKKPG